MLSPIDVPAFLREYEFIIERSISADEAESLSKEMIASITPRLSRFPAFNSFLHAHMARVLNRRLEKLNAKAEADAGSERAKAGSASKRG